MTNSVLQHLLASDEPSVRWRARRARGEERGSDAMRALERDVRDSARVRSIIRAASGVPPYSKWRGAHWALQSLASLGYPAGDDALFPLRDAVLDQWLAPRYLVDRDVASITKSVGSTAVPRVDGRSRRCGSQHGGALLAIVTLGIDDGRAATLAERLRDWQWPDGGWNCDRTPSTRMSSVNETLLPMRGLFAYGVAAGDELSRAAAVAASEVLLTRRVAWRRTSPAPIAKSVLQLHHPVYWHYDLLAGLVGLAELGLLGDPRCSDALDELESRRNEEGGWSVGARYWKVADDGSNVESVSWGPVSSSRTNEWVTCDALAVLHAAGRL
jgi:hypothetical protein